MATVLTLGGISLIDIADGGEDVGDLEDELFTTGRDIPIPFGVRRNKVRTIKRRIRINGPNLAGQIQAIDEVLAAGNSTLQMRTAAASASISTFTVLPSPPLHVLRSQEFEHDSWCHADLTVRVTPYPEGAEQVLYGSPALLSQSIQDIGPNLLTHSSFIGGEQLIDVAMSEDGQHVWVLAVHSTLGAVTVWHSGDYGATFTSVDSISTIEISGGICCDSTGAKAAWCVPNQYIRVTTNTGASWANRDSQRNWIGIAADDALTNIVAAVGGGQLYQSTNGGTSFTARDSNRSWYYVDCCIGSTIFWATASTGLYKSTDSGQTWTNVAAAGTQLGCVSADASGQIIIVWNYNTNVSAISANGGTTFPYNPGGRCDVSPNGGIIVRRMDGYISAGSDYAFSRGMNTEPSLAMTAKLSKDGRYWCNGFARADLQCANTNGWTVSTYGMLCLKGYGRLVASVGNYSPVITLGTITCGPGNVYFGYGVKCDRNTHNGTAKIQVQWKDVSNANIGAAVDIYSKAAAEGETAYMTTIVAPANTVKGVVTASWSGGNTGIGWLDIAYFAAYTAFQTLPAVIPLSSQKGIFPGPLDILLQTVNAKRIHEAFIGVADSDAFSQYIIEAESVAAASWTGGTVAAGPTTNASGGASIKNSNTAYGSAIYDVQRFSAVAGMFRLFAIATMENEADTGYIKTDWTDEVSFTVPAGGAGKWRLVDLGYIYLPTRITTRGVASPLTVSIKSSSAVGGHAVCLDYLWPCPVDNGSIYFHKQTASAGAARLQISGGQVIVDDVSDQSEVRGTTLISKGGALVITARDPGANDGAGFEAALTIKARPRYHTFIGDV